MPCADVTGRNSAILCLGSGKFGDFARVILRATSGCEPNLVVSRLAKFGGKFALFWWQFRCVYVEIWQGNLVVITGNLVEKIGAVARNL